MLFHVGNGSAFSVFVRKEAKSSTVRKVPTAAPDVEAADGAKTYSLLFTLPEELLVGVVNLLWFNDIARMESAMVRKEHRLILANIAGRIATQGDPRYLWDKNSLNWLTTSKIRPTNLTLDYTISDQNLSAAADVLRHARNVVFHKHGKFSSAHIVALSACCENLQSLTLSTTQELSVESMTQLAVNAPNLQSLNLSYVRGVAATALAAITQHCPLTHLDLSGAPVPRPDAVLAWAQHCAGLQSLNLNNCAFSVECLQIVCLYCTSLTSLDLGGNANLNDDDILMVVSRCTLLTTLRIDGLRNLSQATIAAITRHLPHLAELSIVDSFTIATPSWAELMSVCTCLQRITVSELQESDFFQSLVEHCPPRLTHLSLHRLSAFSEDGWSLIAPRLGQVVELVLPGGAVTDRVLSDIAAACPLLESLIMSQAEKVTVQAFCGLTRACPKLRTLKVRSCPQLNDEAICTLAENCRSLEELDVSWAPQLTDVSIVALAAKCPGLRVVNVNHCSQLTNSSMEAILVGCRRLAVLEVYGCEKIDRARVFRALQKVRWI